MSATLHAPAPAEPVNLVEALTAPVDPAAELHDARTTLRAVSALLQGFAQAGHMSEEHAGQACRLVQLATGPLMRAGQALAPQPEARTRHTAEPDAEAHALASELAEFSDTAEGLCVAFELIGEGCGSGDPERAARLTSLAFMLAGVAGDLAMALSEAAERKADWPPQRRAAR
jgi:hypothetical protein